MLKHVPKTPHEERKQGILRLTLGLFRQDVASGDTGIL